MSAAAIGFADAIASPTPITAEPTYSGCATYRYGPDDVISRDLYKWPAAQMRMPSPTSATIVPTTTDSFDGLARMNTSGAHTQPSATRNRASSCIMETDGSRTGRQRRQTA